MSALLGIVAHALIGGVVGGLVGWAGTTLVWRWTHRTAGRRRGWAWPAGPASAGSPRHARWPR